MRAASFSPNANAIIGLMTCFPWFAEGCARSIQALPRKQNYLLQSTLCCHRLHHTTAPGVGCRARAMFPQLSRLFSSAEALTPLLLLLATPVPSTGPPYPGAGLPPCYMSSSHSACRCIALAVGLQPAHVSRAVELGALSSLADALSSTLKSGIIHNNCARCFSHFIDSHSCKFTLSFSHFFEALPWP